MGSNHNKIQNKMIHVWILSSLIILVVATIALASNPNLKSQPHDWSNLQKEVWATVESYTQASHQRDLQLYLSYWHPDFLGWHNGDDAPTSFSQRAEGLKNYFNSTKSMEYKLEPLAIQIIAAGKTAIVHYKLFNVLQSNKTGKMHPGTSYWTDYLVKEDDKWLLIGDHGGNVQVTNKSLAQFDWLLGKWKRTNEREGKTTFEIWSRESDTKLRGLGFTMQKQDTVFTDKMSIALLGDQLYYIAEVSHNEQPVKFAITQITNQGFVSENPQHDFPKNIEYASEANGFTATISGDGKEIPFRFVKVDSE